MNWVAADLPARFRRGHSRRALFGTDGSGSARRGFVGSARKKVGSGCSRPAVLEIAAAERRHWLVLYVLCVGMLMIVLDATIVRG